LGQAGAGQGFHLDLIGPLEFLGSQAAVISPLLFAGLVFALFQSSYLGFSKHQEEHLFLSLTSLPLLIFFLLLSFHTKVQANWAAPAYFAGFISTAAIFDGLYQALKAKGRERNLRSLVVLALLLAAVPMALVYDTGPLYRAGLPPRWDPTLRLKGWKELGERVSSSWEGMSGAKKTFIFSNRYQISSELAFYVRGRPTTYCVNLGRRFNQYDLWEGFLSLAGQDALYVKQGNHRKVEPEVSRAFASIEREPRLIIRRYGKKVRSFSVFRCFGYRGIQIERPRGTY
jgi:undecaprenyl-diphosphatase